MTWDDAKIAVKERKVANVEIAPPESMAPPAQVTLLYREVGKTFVFTCAEVPGLHIGSSDFFTAFDRAIRGLAKHISAVCGQPVRYKTMVTAEDFGKAILNGRNWKSRCFSVELEPLLAAK